MSSREYKGERVEALQPQASTLVVGLGNPILGDDGIGWHIVRQAEAEWESQEQSHPIDFRCLSTGGLSLMEHLEGYEQAVIADSIVTGNQPSGALYSFPLEELPDFSSGHMNSVHDASLRTALNVGQKMGFSLPRKIWIVAVEIQPNLEFAEDLSPALTAAVPKAAALILERLRHWR